MDPKLSAALPGIMHHEYASTISQTSPGFYVSSRFYKSLKMTVGKGAISPFPTLFSNLLETFQPCLSNFKLSSGKSFNLEESKICRLGKG